MIRRNYIITLPPLGLDFEDVYQRPLPYQQTTPLARVSTICCGIYAKSDYPRVIHVFGLSVRLVSKGLGVCIFEPWVGSLRD